MGGVKEIGETGETGIFSRQQTDGSRGWRLEERFALGWRQETEVGGRKSEIRGQKEIRGQRSDVGGQG
jgi:hypothetical protein